MTDLTLQDNSATEPRAKLGSKLIGAAVRTVGGALFGAVFVAALVQFLLVGAQVFFNLKADLGHLLLYGALAGAALGAMGGYRQARRQLHRQEQTQEGADEPGFRYADRVDEEVADRLREFFPLSDSRVSFRNVIERKCGPARLLVGEVSTEDSCQTVAYFESNQLSLPSFILQPNDLGIKLLSKLVGIAPITFESCPEISRIYDLSATHPEHARLLFDDVLLTYFVLHPGLQVQSEDNRLILFRPGRRFEGAELEEIIGQAEEVVKMFQEATAGTRKRVAKTVPVNPHRASRELRGLAGAVVRRYLVTRQDVDAFLAVPVQRYVPPNIRRQRLASTSAMAAILGPLVGTGGLTLGIGGSWLAGGWNEERITSIVLGMVFCLVGSLTSFFALRYRLRNMRLLRHGILAPATMESIEATEDYVGYERQYCARFRVDAGGRQWTAECNLDGRVARRARQYTKTGEPVRVLYDPNDPNRILWTELLITVSDEYEPRRSDAEAPTGATG